MMRLCFFSQPAFRAPSWRLGEDGRIGPRDTSPITMLLDRAGEWRYTYKHEYKYTFKQQGDRHIHTVCVRSRVAMVRHIPHTPCPALELRLRPPFLPRVEVAGDPPGTGKK